MKFLKIYLINLLIFLGIDSVWLTLISPSLYKQYIGYLLSDNPNLIAALAFYLLYIAGLVYLVIMPALKNKSAKQAFVGGAVLGLISYATYDLTNLAVVDKWPITISLIDMAWGTTLTAVSSYITYKVVLKISK